MTTDDLGEEPVEDAPPAPPTPTAQDARVDAALQRADELAGTSPAEHVEIYEDVHRNLQEVLADASGQTGPLGAAPADSSDDGDAGR